MRLQLETLDTQGLETDLLVIVDNQQIQPAELYEQWAHLHPRIYHTELDALAEHDAWTRRERIVHVMNLAREKTRDTDYVFIIEDDTQIKPSYLKDLLKHTTENTGVISGIQAGRWAGSMIGIWNTDNINNPTKWTTAQLPDSTAL